ncbi:MAG: manganese efflux pump MntP family protein [Flavobacteriales bacterium]|nr:manganese efflux pump MntP family protein [Flavobacteriales bacterium]
MSAVEIFILAIGLSMDSFAVSVSSGAVMKSMRWKKVLKIAFFLSAFQALMPLLGWALGEGFSRFISQWDHWIAFALLLFLGGKMLFESIFSKQEGTECTDKCEHNTKCCPWKTRTLIGMSIATSIDAAAVGVSFSFLNMGITTPTIIIFFTTAFFSLIGMLIGTRFGARYHKGAEMLGGIILMAIGAKILIEHIFF